MNGLHIMRSFHRRHSSKTIWLTWVVVWLVVASTEQNPMAKKSSSTISRGASNRQPPPGIAKNRISRGKQASGRTAPTSPRRSTVRYGDHDDDDNDDDDTLDGGVDNEEDESIADDLGSMEEEEEEEEVENDDDNNDEEEDDDQDAEHILGPRTLPKSKSQRSAKGSSRMRGPEPPSNKRLPQRHYQQQQASRRSLSLEDDSSNDWQEDDHVEIDEQEEEEDENDDDNMDRHRRRHPRGVTKGSSRQINRDPRQGGRVSPKSSLLQPQSRKVGRSKAAATSGVGPRVTGKSKGTRKGNVGVMVPHKSSSTGRITATATFAKGLMQGFMEQMPDPAFVKESALASIQAARETTSSLSANLYREVKGLSSSELERVMLKATRPDDTPIKSKHVERLIAVTYQVSPRFGIYDAVLRKLWAKLVEKDWRTKVKALYILHRFAADGAPGHAPALKARLRELRRTRDPKRKEKFFNSKQLLAGETKPEIAGLRSFLSRYSHYVILRAQCFGGMFDEISQAPPTTSAVPTKGSGSSSSSAKNKDKGSNKTIQLQPKPITSTSLRKEHLEAASMLLKAGVACQLKEGEESENTAIAVERVASDLIHLTSAVAMALNRALKHLNDDKNDDDYLKGSDPVLLKQWIEFYRDELVPQTRAMVKKTSNKLDAYGLFLPSRMGTSVSSEVLQKAMNRLTMEQPQQGKSQQKKEVEEEVAAAADINETSSKEKSQEPGPGEEKQETKSSDSETTEKVSVVRVAETSKSKPGQEAVLESKMESADTETKSAKTIKTPIIEKGDEDEDDYDDDDEYEDDDDEYEDEEDDE